MEQSTNPDESINPMPDVPVANGVQPQQSQEALGQTTDRNVGMSLSLKALVIAILSLLLLLPALIIASLDSTRKASAMAVQAEVASKWGEPQHITGPVIMVPMVKDNKVKNVYFLPQTLNVNDTVMTEHRHRGIYDVVVYNTVAELSGSFNLKTLIDKYPDKRNLKLNEAMVKVGVTDLRGLSAVGKISLGGTEYALASSGTDPLLKSAVFDQFSVDNENETYESSYKRYSQSVIYTSLDLSQLANIDSVAYNFALEMKGSDHICFTPIGEETTVRIGGDCDTPSFNGSILPVESNVATDGSGFDATWKVIGLNRPYPQLFTDDYSLEMSESQVQVSMRVPVAGHLMTERAIKYALLVIVLTFVAALFTEVKTGIVVNIFQYILIGLALVLFYSLLLSMSEHMVFGCAYLIAAVMTVVMITLFLMGVFKARKQAVMIGGLLAIMYTYIYVLLSLETYALLVGSLGLFVILGAIMYYSLDLKPVTK